MNELLLTLSEKEISVILFNLEEKYGHLLDGEIPEEVQTIFSKLEGAVDAYYDGQESEFDGQVYTQGWTKTDEIHEIANMTFFVRIFEKTNCQMKLVAQVAC